MLEKVVRRPTVMSRNPPMLVLLHGLGADEHDLIGIAPELDKRLTVVSLRAPNVYEQGGRAWFDIKWDATGPRADAEGAVKSRDTLIQVMAGLADELRTRPSRVFLGGFSQGGMMSLGVSLKIPQYLAGVLVLSGRLLPQFATQEEIPDAFAHLPFLVHHGIKDQVLPIENGRVIKAFLESKGGPLTYREYPMAHEITRDSIDGIRAWMSRFIG